MFASFSSFSIFFFSVSALLLIGIIFEEKFLALEEKFDKYIERKKRLKKQEQLRKYKAIKMQAERKNMQRRHPDGSIRNYAA